MKGKACIITGATGGIGLEAAARLGLLGARLMLVGRSRDKGEAALAQLRARVPSVAVEMHYADLFPMISFGSRAICWARPRASTFCSTTRARFLRAGPSRPMGLSALSPSIIWAISG
jgi:NAD(P)-dependent dehydrogenase (short-subunit alcohol dehydrogenase family)